MLGLIGPCKLKKSSTEQLKLGYEILKFNTGSEITKEKTGKFISVCTSHYRKTAFIYFYHIFHTFQFSNVMPHRRLNDDFLII